MKIALAVLIAAAWTVVADGTSPPLDHGRVCALLAAADALVIADHIRQDLVVANVRQRHAFESATYACEGRSYPTQIGQFRPAYVDIGFSGDDTMAIVGIESWAALQSDVGRGYNCVFRRTAANEWDAIGCRVVVWLPPHEGPPEPAPIP